MKRAFPALLALLCATLALLIATTSSPLYAANFWTDTNIYFTIGRGMTRGLMPYRDLFDHKGPLLFMLYALGAAISDTSFIGVFILEALSLAAAVYAGWRTVSLFGEGRLTLLSMPILAAVVCCCTAFTQGGSAEEFALPALAAGVYLALALMARPGERDGRRALGFGAAAGWVFLIKYTDIGLFAGLGIGLLAFVWRREGFGRARNKKETLLCDRKSEECVCCWARCWSARRWRRIWRPTGRWAPAWRSTSSRTCLITAARR